jgi:hypothetical protein
MFWSTTAVWRTQLDLFSESFELKQKAELVQISIETRMDTVGERTDALPSAPGESAFQQPTNQKGIFIHKRSHYKGGVDGP